MSKRGTQAQLAAQMTTMRSRKGAEALAQVPPLLAEVGAAFEGVRRQVVATAPSITAMLSQLSRR